MSRSASHTASTRRDREAAGEHGQAREQAPLVRLEQLDSSTRSSRAGSAGAPGDLALADASSVQPCRQPLEDRLRREQLDARGRELERQRQAVERDADARDRAALDVVERKSGCAARARATKSAHGRVRGEVERIEQPVDARERKRRERILVLARQAEDARLVTSTFTAGARRRGRPRAGRRRARARSCPARGASASRRRWRATAVGDRTSRRFVDARASARSSTRRAPPPRAGELDEGDAARKEVEHLGPSPSATRVFPMPPGPVIVTSRTSSAVSTRPARPAPGLRPRSGVTGAGRVLGAPRGAGAARERRRPDAGSRARAPAAPRPGSIPRSSTQRPARLPEGLERVGLATRAVEREHELCRSRSRYGWAATSRSRSADEPPRAARAPARRRCGARSPRAASSSRRACSARANGASARSASGGPRQGERRTKALCALGGPSAERLRATRLRKRSRSSSPGSTRRA